MQVIVENRKDQGDQKRDDDNKAKSKTTNASKIQKQSCSVAVGLGGLTLNSQQLEVQQDWGDGHLFY